MATESVVTAAFRLGFPQVFEAKAGEDGGKPKFSINMIFPPEPLLPADNGATLNALRKLALEAIKGKWGDDKAKWPANLRNIDPKTYLSPNGKDGWPFRDGNAVDWEGFEGSVFLRASTLQRPGVVNAKVRPVLDQSEVYGGLICRAQINAYAYDTAGNKGVTFGLNNLQILKDDGTAYSGRQRAEDAFEAYGDSGSSAGADDDNW